MSKDVTDDSRFTYDERDTAAVGALPAIGNGHRVLHIDGDDDAALVLATLLVPDVHVTHAATIGEAARLIGQEQFSLVVLDPDLPDGDGSVLIDTLRVIRAETPLLLYSARPLRHGGAAQAYLPKPWTSPRQLWRTVSHMLGLESLLAVRT